MATAKWKEVNGTLLMVVAKEPTPAEWREQMDFAYGLGTRMKHCLIFTDISLTSLQRREVVDLCTRAGTRMSVVVTNSPVTRMVVTAIGWFIGVKAFDTSDADAAFDALKRPIGETQELLLSAHGFAEELGMSALARVLASRIGTPVSERAAHG